MQALKFAPALTNLLLTHQGKARDTYSVDTFDSEVKKKENQRLVFATNRISTHNVVHKSEVPHKGEVLTALTIFWLTNLLAKRKVPHHLVAHGQKIYDYLPGTRHNYPQDLHHRAIVVKKLVMSPVEFIYRGYLAGSLYHQFYAKGIPNPYGVELKPGLPVMTPFSKPIFTPTDKSETDDPLEAAEIELRFKDAVKITRLAFLLIREHLREVGLEMVDSKFEAGRNHAGAVALADEIATPDSSRFCLLTNVKPGTEPPWLDKQVARNEAERIWSGGKKVALEFSPEIVSRLSQTYLEIFRLIVGQSLGQYQREYLD